MSMFNIIEKREIHFLHEIQSVAFKNLIQLSIRILTVKRHVHLIFILQYSRCKKYCVPNLNKLVKYIISKIFLDEIRYSVA